MADSPADLTWVREESPVWDADKTRVIGGAPEGAFTLTAAEGEALPGDWWAARDSSGVVGYGRLDTTWGGDAEILLAVSPTRQGGGVGTFILGKLDEEAASRGLNYVHNRIREHAERDAVHDWLVVRGFSGTVDGDLRKRVGTTYATPTSHSQGQPPVTPYDASDPADRAPGREDQGGYVDVEEHQY